MGSPTLLGLAHGRVLALSLLIPTLIATDPTGAERTADETDYGVFVRLVHDAGLSVPAAVARLEEAAAAQGWDVLATFTPGTPPDGCSFDARVLVLYSANYARAIMPYGSHAAFALPLRLAVFEDEEGVHVGALNTLNLNRTIVDEAVPGDAWEAWQNRLHAVVEAAFPGELSATEYGQFRGRGRIGRTMGIMAGGPFLEKIETIVEVPAEGTSVQDVANRLESRFGAAEGEWEWGLDAVYLLYDERHDVAVVGVTGKRVEGDAFRIVGAGGDDDRKQMMYPGVDHAAAFPIEVVVTQDGDVIRVQLVDEMYRMKMFFEDAGKIAFAKNMGMPGSIEDEIKKKVRATIQ
jgi:uncharacterized protein (DUF302 family)